MKRSSEVRHQLLYFPYLHLKGTAQVRYANAIVWNADTEIDQRIPDKRVRKKVAALLAMNTMTGRGSRRIAVSDIGVLTIGDVAFLEVTAKEAVLIYDVRRALFLSCLSRNAYLPSDNQNATHSVYTSENFDLASQHFVLSASSIGENTGVLVPRYNSNYSIRSTRLPKPGFVNLPSPFRCDETLLAQLQWLRRNRKKLYRRIMQASEVFIGSYYNAQNVSLPARILLQVAAFAILLDLSDQQQRMDFKDAIEKHADGFLEPRYSYQFEKGKKKGRETRSRKVMWADRFYTLRNHIIHGERVSERAYLFKGEPHLAIAAKFFVFLIKCLIDEARDERGVEKVFVDRIDWKSWKYDRDGAPAGTGRFVLAIDTGFVFAKAIEKRNAMAKMRAERAAARRARNRAQSAP